MRLKNTGLCKGPTVQKMVYSQSFLLNDSRPLYLEFKVIATISV